ncbi:hypothetical protein [Marinomonas sp. THO17]|uniref:hypothetical protein n=1 Tax=Marinomonas sp. THO17 TaxID=3149048 RepID=UPI00336BDF2E
MSLYNQPEKWAYVLGQIETGAKPWLNIADLLKAHSDAATTRGLNYAMFFALKNAPSNVLTVLGKHYSVKEVCVSPFIENELEYELGFLKTIRNRLIKTTTVSNEKASCLASIEQQISDFSKMPH